MTSGVGVIAWPFRISSVLRVFNIFNNEDKICSAFRAKKKKQVDFIAKHSNIIHCADLELIHVSVYPHNDIVSFCPINIGGYNFEFN